MAQIDDNAEVPTSPEVKQADLSSEEWLKRIRQLVKWKPRLWWGAIFIGTVLGIVASLVLGFLIGMAAEGWSIESFTRVVLLSAWLTLFLGGGVAGAFAGFRGTMHGLFAGLSMGIVSAIITIAYGAALGLSGALYLFIIDSSIISIAWGVAYGTLGGGLGCWLRNKIGSSAKHELIKSEAEARKEAAVLELAKALQHSDPDVRIKAAKALTNFGTSAIDAVPVLIEILRSDEEYLDVTCSAIKALGAIRSQEAIPILRDIKNDNTWQKIVRGEATDALTNIGRAKQEYEHTTPPPDAP